MFRIISVLIFLSIIFLSLLMACDDIDLYYYAKNGPEPERVLIFLCEGTFNGDMGGRNGIDELCRKQYDAKYSYLNAYTIKGFISVSPSDQISFLIPLPYWDAPVYVIHAGTLEETLVSASWTSMWLTGPAADFSTAGNIGAPWWSGSNSLGIYAGDNCNGWTSSSADVYGMAGSNSVGASPGWISDTTGDCSVNYNLLCMAY